MPPVNLYIELLNKGFFLRFKEKKNNIQKILNQIGDIVLRNQHVSVISSKNHNKWEIR